MLCVVDVRAVRNDAGDAGRVGLAGATGRSVHHLQIAVAQEVAGTTEAVDHAGTADQSRVGMGIHVNLNRGVHGNTTQTTDRFRCIGDGKRTQGNFVEIFVHVFEKFREAR